MDDLISRTEIISTFTELGKTGRYGGMCEWVIEIVKQLPPAELSTNLAELGTDCISRQSAIDALRKLREEDIEDYGCEIPEGFNQDHLDRATFAIKQLPSAQPEIKQQAINSSDCIDRRAALGALRVMQTYKLFAGDDMLLIDQAGAQTELMLLPSAQPEIVRCKDCLYQRICSWKLQGAEYCSRAERREVTE